MVNKINVINSTGAICFTIFNILFDCVIEP